MGWRGWGIAGVLGGVAWASPAAAQPMMMDDDVAGVVAIVIPIAGVVASGGAQVKLLEGEPSEGWGRVSLGLSGANAVAAGVLSLVAALGDDGDAPAFYTLTWVVMGIAHSGFVSGIVTEATLDESDPGIPGEPRPPSGLPAMWTVGGAF